MASWWFMILANNKNDNYVCAFLRFVLEMFKFVHDLLQTKTQFRVEHKTFQSHRFNRIRMVCENFKVNYKGFYYGRLKTNKIQWM